MSASGRLDDVAAAIEVFVEWARVLEAQRTFPFGDLELTRSQLEVLFLIAHSDQPATPGALARALRVTPGAVTQVLAGVLDAGLVEQRRDPGDARRRVLELSPAARERVESAERAITASLAPRFAGLDDDELQLLAGLLGRTKGIG